MDANGNDKHEDVLSQTRDNEGSRATEREDQGSREGEKEDGEEQMAQKQPLKNASEMEEHSSTDLLLPGRLETTNVESKVMGDPSSAIIEECHSDEEAKKPNRKAGRRQHAGDKKPIGIKPITVQIFQIPESLHQRRTVETAGWREEPKTKGALPPTHAGQIVNIGHGAKGDHKGWKQLQFNSFDHRLNKVGQSPLNTNTRMNINNYASRQGPTPANQYPPGAAHAGKNAAGQLKLNQSPQARQKAQQKPGDDIVGALLADEGAGSLRHAPRSGRPAPAYHAPTKLSLMASNLPRSSQPFDQDQNLLNRQQMQTLDPRYAYDSRLTSNSIGEGQPDADWKAAQNSHGQGSASTSGHGPASTILRRDEDGSNANAHALRDHQGLVQGAAELKHIHNKMSVEVVERRKTVNQDVNEGGEVAEDRIWQAGTGASGYRQKNFNPAAGDKHSGAGAPKRPGAEETSAQIGKLGYGSSARQTRAPDLHRLYQDGEEEPVIVHIRDNNHSTEQSHEIPEQEFREGQFNELHQAPIRLAPPKRAIGGGDHSKYTSYPAVRPQKTFRNLKDTLDSHIAVSVKDTKGHEDLQESSLFSTTRTNQDAATTLETFKNYKNNILNLPPVGGAHAAVHSEEHSQAQTGHTTPAIFTPGNGQAAGASMVAAGDAGATRPPSLFVFENAKHGKGTTTREGNPTKTPEHYKQGARSRRHFHVKRLTATQESGQYEQAISAHVAGGARTNKDLNSSGSGAPDRRQFRAANPLALRLKKNSVIVELKQPLDHHQHGQQQQPSQDLFGAGHESHGRSLQSSPNNTTALNQTSARTSSIGQKFHFLQKLVHRGEQRGQQVKPAFIPYTQERGGFGELLETENIYHLEELDLGKQIKDKAVARRNDPARQTTEQNLRKTRQNASMKVSEQMKFSKRNELALQSANAASVSIDSWNQRQALFGTDQSQQDSQMEVDQIQVSLPSQFQSVNSQHTSITPFEATINNQKFESSRHSIQLGNSSINMQNFERNIVGAKRLSVSLAAPLNQRAERTQQMIQQPATQTKTVSAAWLNKRFTVKLPGSASHVSTSVEQSSNIQRPQPFLRQNVKSFLKPRIFDLVREQTKDQNRSLLKFLSPRNQEMQEQDRSIPVEMLASHVEDFEDYPTHREYRPIANLPPTFGSTARFPNHQFEYTPHAMDLSILDFHDKIFVDKNTAPFIGKYTRRPDNFLTRSQELQLLAEKEEAAMRAQRIQQLRATNDQEAAANANHKAESGQHAITFPHGHHVKALAARPYIKGMVETMIAHARQSGAPHNREESTEQETAAI